MAYLEFSRNQCLCAKTGASEGKARDKRFRSNLGTRLYSAGLSVSEDQNYLSGGADHITRITKTSKKWLTDELMVQRPIYVMASELLNVTVILPILCAFDRKVGSRV